MCDKYRTWRLELDREVEGIIRKLEWKKRKEEEDRGIKAVLELTGDEDND